jgi:molecular chaperone GrpE
MSEENKVEEVQEANPQDELQKNPQDDTQENLQKLAGEVLRLRDELNVKDDMIMREKAENQNLRSRHTRELDDKGKYAIGEFSKDLVEVMESLYRALEFKKDFDMNDNKIAGMFDGIDMTLKLLDKTFTKYEIKRIFPINEEFDHRYHQAISKIALAENSDNQIVDVIQAGYTIHDRLLKPALVIVNVNKVD